MMALNVVATIGHNKEYVEVWAAEGVTKAPRACVRLEKLDGSHVADIYLDRPLREDGRVTDLFCVQSSDWTAFRNLHTRGLLTETLGDGMILRLVEVAS